jgi:hypothetical protein
MLSEPIQFLFIYYQTKVEFALTILNSIIFQVKTLNRPLFQSLGIDLNSPRKISYLTALIDRFKLLTTNKIQLTNMTDIDIVKPSCSTDNEIAAVFQNVQTQHGDASVDEENIVVLKRIMSPTLEELATCEAVWFYPITDPAGDNSENEVSEFIVF